MTEGSDARKSFSMKALQAIPKLQMTEELAEKPPLPELIRRYLEGESIQVLAKKYGKSRRTIYNWMLSGVGMSITGPW